jgi:hypothetical protein
MMADFWQMTAYRIAKRIAETSNIDLTFDMVKEVEAELRTINNMYIIKLYVGMIKPEQQKEVVEAMKELLRKRGCKFE